MKNKVLLVSLLLGPVAALGQSGSFSSKCGNNADCATIVSLLKARDSAFKDLRSGDPETDEQGRTWDADTKLGMDFCMVQEDSEGTTFSCRVDFEGAPSRAQPFFDSLKKSVDQATDDWIGWTNQHVLMGHVSYRRGPDHSHYAIEIFKQDIPYSINFWVYEPSRKEKEEEKEEK